MFRQAAVFAGMLALIPAARAQAPADLVARGEYLARAADCAACHTAPGGQPFAGGLGIATPLGTIVSTNITPSKNQGIGGYTADQFSHAVRDGIRADGANLYPAMPYTSYAGITDSDMAALYAYFTQTVKPVDVAAAATRLPFPFDIRASMKLWNLLFLDRTRFQPDPKQSAAWNRGAYLVGALAHCSTCHTPRNALMAENHAQDFAGASLGTWYAPNITPDANAGIHSWTAQQLTDYLRDGHSSNGAQAAGPMLEAIDKSLNGMTDADLQAMVTYIRSVPAIGSGGAPVINHGPAMPSDIALRAMPPAAPVTMNGAQLYDAYCATCHRVSGGGVPGEGLPALIGNTALRRPNADNAIMTVLDGVWPQRSAVQAMPGFAALLSDDQVARLTDYLFQQFGTAAVTVTPAHVAELRQGGAASPLIMIIRIGMAVAAAIALIAVVVVTRLWRSRHRGLQVPQVS